MSVASNQARNIVPGAHFKRAASAVALRRAAVSPDPFISHVEARDGVAVCKIRDINGVLFEAFLTRRLECMSLAQAFGDYLSKGGTRARQQSSIHKMADYFEFFTNFIVDYYGGTQSDFGVSHLSVSVMRDYERWLLEYRYEDKAKIVKSLSPQTVGIRYNAIRQFLRWCRSETRFELNPTIDLNRTVARLRHHKIQPRDPLSISQLALVRSACLQEIRSTVALLKRGQDIKIDNSISVPPANAPMTAYKNIKTAIKTIFVAYGGLIIAGEQLKKERPGLERAMRHYYSTDDVTAYLYFNRRMIAPFVIMIAMDTFFNATTVLGLKWSDIREDHVFFGERRWVVGGEKPRAGKRQERSFASGLTDLSSPVRLLLILREYNNTVYKRLPASQNDYVFAYESKARYAATFLHDGNRLNNKHWPGTLQEFCDRHKGIESFGLSGLRKSGAEITYFLSGGDMLAVRDVMNHSSVNTAYTHYSSDGSRKLALEALARAMEWRERYLASGGKSDARNPVHMGGPRSAATLGFNCLEPAYSPVVGQEEGKACSAYGYCPACPLSWVDLNDPVALVRLRQLRQRIVEARSEVAPQRWLVEWAPQLKALNEGWFPKFNAYVEAEADSMLLPSLPTLD